MTDPGRPWRSLDELDRPADAAFPELARAAAIDRRMALRLMAASAALAAASACDRPPSRALRSAPRGQDGGAATTYATTLDHDGRGLGVLVRTVGGRPVKIEGNPLHPASRGATGVRAQAELLSLYDPDRSRFPVEAGRERSWAEARRKLSTWRRQTLAERGAGLHVLLRPAASPTLARLIDRTREALPLARFHGWRPIGEARDGIVPLLAEADVVLCLGADPLGPGPDQVRLAQDWAARRRADGELPRLIVAESVPSLTGARADRRLPLGPREILLLARAIEVGGDIRRLLAEAGPRALVLAGRDQPGEVHDIAARLNAGSRALRTTGPLEMELESVAALAAAIDGGAVRRLVILGGNPVFDAPADLALAARLRRVADSLHLGVTRDETAEACRWHLPASHALERWGDLRSVDGSVGLIQPVSAPLAAGLSEIELLGLLVGERGGGRAMVRRTWAAAAPDAETWLTALENGVIDPLRAPAPAPTPSARAAETVLPEGGLTLLFRPAAHLWDGALANNAWAQELPDPITKLVWGNAATVAPATAAALGIADGDEIAVATAAGTITVPARLLPGQAPDTVAVTLGHGRRLAGRVGSGVGVDAYPLRAAAALWATACTVRRTGGKGRLISTERHHATDDARATRRVAPGGRAAPPSAVAPPPSLLGARKSAGERRWAMAIDLDSCIGCAACTIACQAENNIPVVGADEVAAGREMHWLRVDRVHHGDPAAPETDFQPVPCMHCETAPCEPVCPVGATVHSSEGLNQMTYSRCIGTRTCSNACPYKVRRFNWFDTAAGPLATPEPAQNPAVTIRDRGVMEKCTYCAQRIEAAHQGTADGPPVTACQQVCPTRAIAFGDLADPDSAVAAARRSPRHYALLDELNLSPRTTYLARIAEADNG